MTTEYGTISISNEVIAIIASIAAQEAEGVVRLMGNISEKILGSLKGQSVETQGVRIGSDGDGVTVDLSISVRYGINIQTVAKTVQYNVREAIDTMTGLTTVAVNVTVTDVQIEKDKEVEADTKPRTK